MAASKLQFKLSKFFILMFKILYFKCDFEILSDNLLYIDYDLIKIYLSNIQNLLYKNKIYEMKIKMYINPINLNL